jgi:hypothetical protein
MLTSLLLATLGQVLVPIGNGVTITSSGNQVVAGLFYGNVSMVYSVGTVTGGGSIVFTVAAVDPLDPDAGAISTASGGSVSSATGPVAVEMNASASSTVNVSWVVTGSFSATVWLSVQGLIAAASSSGGGISNPYLGTFVADGGSFGVVNVLGASTFTTVTDTSITTTGPNITDGTLTADAGSFAQICITGSGCITSWDGGAGGGGVTDPYLGTWIADAGNFSTLTVQNASTLDGVYNAAAEQIDGGLFVAQSASIDAGLNVTGLATLGTLLVNGIATLTGFTYQAAGDFNDGGLYVAELAKFDAGVTIAEQLAVLDVDAGYATFGTICFTGGSCASSWDGGGGSSSSGGISNPYLGTFIADAGEFSSVNVENTLVAGQIVSNSYVNGTTSIFTAQNINGNSSVDAGVLYLDNHSILVSGQIDAGTIVASGTVYANAVSASGNVIGGELISNGLIDGTQVIANVGDFYDIDAGVVVAGNVYVNTNIWMSGTSGITQTANALQLTGNSSPIVEINSNSNLSSGYMTEWDNGNGGPVIVASVNFNGDYTAGAGTHPVIIGSNESVATSPTDKISSDNAGDMTVVIPSTASFQVLSSNSSYPLIVGGNGDVTVAGEISISASGAVPGVEFINQSSSGTNPKITTGNVSTCVSGGSTYNFQTSGAAVFTATPFCVCSPATGGTSNNAVSCTATTATITCYDSTSSVSTNYICIGN